MRPAQPTAQHAFRLGRLLVLLVLTSCATDEVVVATLDSNAEPCTTNADCLPTAYCAKATCSDSNGSCRLRPLLCDDPTSAPTCDCSGVTYWNDCLRMQSGAAAATAGECAAEAASCVSVDASDCPVPGASCARLLPVGPACPADTIGACWVLPSDCPVPSPGMRWLACDGSNACDDTCTAIRSGVPHRHSFSSACH